MSPVLTFPNTQTWNITNACATWDGQASKHPGAHRLVKVSYDMNHIDRGRVFFPRRWDLTECCMISKNRDSFKDYKPERYSLTGCHLFKSTLSAFLKDVPQSHRSYWSQLWGKGMGFCCLFMMEDRCGSSNDPTRPETLWNSKDSNKSYLRSQTRGGICGRKAFFHSYTCHNKLSNRIMSHVVFTWWQNKHCF